MINKLKRAVNK